MTTLTANTPAVKPATAIETPRDSWPDWTDSGCWELGPDPDDEPRPTAGPDFIPAPQEEAEAAGLLDGDDEPDDAYWDARAEAALNLDRACSGQWAF